MAPWVKICGITSVDDAEVAVAAGADAIGLNFVESSRRRVERAAARAICDRVRGSVELVLVVADMQTGQLEALKGELEADWLQLHGSEGPAAVVPLLPRAYKAVRIHDEADVALAEAFAGERILVDSKVAGELGGTGKTFDHSLVKGLCRRRSVIVAGGLVPDNVARVVELLAPFGVDTASGVEFEASPGRKDPERVRAFVSAAKKSGTAPR
jgi:phosphoribosylanthranilate isomerase